MRKFQIVLIFIMLFLIVFLFIFLYGDDSNINIAKKSAIKREKSIKILNKKEAKESYLKFKNLLTQNSNLDGVKDYSGVEYHKYIPNQSHSKDGSGSIKIIGHWSNKALVSPKFKLEKGKYYTFGAYIKAVGANKGQNIIFNISGAGYSNEMNFNVSKANRWESVVFPYRANKTGYYQIRVFTYKYSFTTDKKYAKKDGSNLDRSASIYVDDFYVYESRSDKIVTKEKVSKKVPFKSQIVKVDSLGNWYIKESGSWRGFFPRFVYQDWSSNFAKSAKMYASYGFSGYVNLYGVDDFKEAIKNGMRYNGIQINDLDVNKPKDEIKETINSVNRAIEKKELPKTSLILYEFDNEGEALCNYKKKRDIANWITKADGGKRLRPINMLNGVSEGVARNYKNRDGKNYIDTTSTYVAEIENNFKADFNQSYNPINTLGILQKSQNQIAPVSIMQLQCYYGKKMIPYIFKGISEGAKGLNFWRAGDGVPDVCPKNFEDNYFAPALKSVFAKIDKMLPIIEQPLNTTWSAEVDRYNLVALGTRENAGKHYIILANFADKDLSIKVKLQGLKTNSVKDYFSKKLLSKVNNKGIFTINIGHNNSGFLVLELE